MFSAITGIVTALVKKKIAGEVVGLLASKTQWGASSVAAGGIWASLPGALNKDPEAIGQIALIVLGWLATLWGRLTAKLKKGK